MSEAEEQNESTMGAEVREQLLKVKKRVRKIKLVSERALSHDKKQRHALIAGLVAQYDAERAKSDLKSIKTFYAGLKKFLDIFEAQKAAEDQSEGTKGEESQIRVEGLYQELPPSKKEEEDTEMKPAEEEEKKPKKKKAKDVCSEEDKRKWNDYKEMEDAKKGKFEDEEIDKLKCALCQYVKVLQPEPHHVGE